MKWREDDTIRFYRDVPDKRGVSELVINTPQSRLFHHFRQCSLRPYPPLAYVPSDSIAGQNLAFVPFLQEKTPTFTLRKQENRRAYIATFLFHHI